MAKRTQKRVRVGLVGEDDQDHDYGAIKVLLENQYGERIQCVQLGRRLTGDKLAIKTRRRAIFCKPTSPKPNDQT